jgi:gamma-D-glutamyl-L-lysine dipeptidyl-peptidase
MIGSICTLGFIPVRSEPTEKAEMVTQILFGETYSIELVDGAWAKVVLDDDGYQGWIDAKLIESVPDLELNKWRESDGWILPVPQLKIISEPDKHFRLISGGSKIVFNGSEMNSFVIDNHDFYASGNINPHKKNLNIQELAMGYLHTPYLWGGRTFYGIDCSGLVQVVYKMMGQRIPRDASKQVELGEIVSFVEEAVPGDLAFFDNEEGRIVHVGLCIGRGEIIHASGEVRIDKLDHQGIFNQEKKKYTHKLRVMKRLDFKKETVHHPL